MSQIGTGELDRRLRRTRVNLGPERTGITERLLAPGVVPIGPQSASANLIAQFDQALGVSGQFANQVTATLERERIKDERTQATQDRIDAGRASIDSRVDLAQDLDNLSDKGLDWYAELEQSGKSVEDYADDLIGLRTEGMTDAYRERYESLYKPAIVSNLLGKRQQLEATEQDELFKDMADVLAVALDGQIGSIGEAEAILGDMRTLFPDMSEVDITAPLVHIGFEAAQRGDDGAVERVTALLGNHHVTDQQRMQRMLTAKAKEVNATRVGNIEDMLQSSIEANEPAESILARIDNFEDDLPQLSVTRLRNRLAARERGKVDAEQGAHLNTVDRNVTLGLHPDNDPNATAQSIIEDMFRPSDDPQFIPASKGRELLGRLEQGLKTSAYRLAVESKLAGDNSLPLTASYDTAIDQAFADRGLVDAIPTENGQALIRGIRDPAKFAFASDKAGRVTNGARAVIAAGLAGDQEQAFQAAEAYVALHRQNPALAEQVVQNMEGKAKLRARFLLARLPQSSTPWTERGFLQLEPMQIDKDTLRQTVWAPDSKDPVRDSKVRKDAREFIEEAINETDFEDTFGFGFGRHFGPISNITAQRYADILQDEFTFARAMTDSDEMALTMAKKQAASRFLSENPPMIWDGEILITNGASTVTPDFQAIVEADLKREGWTEDAIENLVDNYRPVWNRAEQAWGFRDEDGLVYTMSTKDDLNLPLLIRPYDPVEIESIREQADQWERDTREKRKKRINKDTFEGLDPTTIQSIP